MSKIITGAKALNLAVEKVEKTVAAIKSDVHNLCLSLVLHHTEHGDTTLINRLCDIMEKASHANAVRHWFNEYGNVSWDSAKKQFVHSKQKVEEAKADMDAFQAKLFESKPYYDMTKPTTFSPVNIMGVLASAINRYNKMTDEEKASPRNNTTGMDEAIALLKKLGMGDKIAA